MKRKMKKKTGKTKKILVISGMVLLLIFLIFFLFFVKKPEEKEDKNRDKNKEETMQETESENDEKRTDQEVEFTEEEKGDVYREFTRGKKRYTQKEVIYESDGDMVSLDSTEICKEIGCDAYKIKEYLTAYALEQDLSCGRGKILDYCYAQMPDASRKIYIFIQMDDKKKTLVTVIYEPATRDAWAYYDIVPCQYSIQEIREQAWYKKEVQ